MHRSLLWTTAVLAACHSYSPAPVDLTAHLATFLARLPEPAAMAAAIGAETSPFTVDLTDGLDRREGRLVAICFFPECRTARARAGIAEAERDHAGRLPDPELSFDVARILETVAHPWIVGGALGIPLPISGRLARQRDLASAMVDEQLAAVWCSERAAADAVDAAWVRWSHEHARVELLAEVCSRLTGLCTIAERLVADGTLMHQSARVFTLERTQRELDLLAAQQTAAGLELELKRRLGLHPAAKVTFVPELAVDLQIADAGVRLGTLDLGPRVLPARIAHRRAERELALEVEKQWPDLVLAPGFAEEDAQPRVALGLSLPLPLFGGNDAAIARSRSARDAAAAALRQSFEIATQELAAAELRLTQVQARRAFVTERIVPLAEQQVEDGRRLAELGQLEPLLLLDALSRARDARLQALDASLQEALAVVAINEQGAGPQLPAAEEPPR